MLFNPVSLLALALAITPGIEAAPVGDAAPLIPGLRRGLPGIAPRLEFSQNAAIFFDYRCPVGGLGKRMLTLKINFDGEDTTIEDAGNAEVHVVRHVQGPPNMSYRVNSFVQHNMCLARAGFRACGYSLSATLQADVDGKSTTAKYNVPRRAGPFNVIPSVTEACTPVNSRVSDCDKAKHFVACEIINVFALEA